MTEPNPINIASDTSGPIALVRAIRKRASSATGRLRAYAAPCRLVASLFFLMATLPSAQAAGSRSDVLIYCSAYAADLKTVFVRSGGERYQALDLSTANVIELPESLAEDGKILLYGAPGENGKRPVLAVAETNGIQRPLIVLFPAGEKAESAYGAKAIEADISKFKLSKFQLVNLSPSPVRFTQDDVVIEIETLGDRIYSPPKPAGKPLAVTIDYKTEDRWTLLSSSSWVARHDRRTLVCVQLDPLTGRMNVKSVPLREYPSR
jgi:hypothetical protein